MNKFARVSGIENYPIAEVYAIWETYEDFIEKNNNKDPEFPDLKFNTESK